MGQLSGIQTSLTVQSTGSIVVGNSVISATSIGIGTTDTTGRNAGVGTAVGTIIYNTDSGIQMYNGGTWITIKSAATATGGTLDEGSARPGYNTHTFTDPGSFTVSGGSLPGCEVLIVGGGGRKVGAGVKGVVIIAYPTA